MDRARLAVLLCALSGLSPGAASADEGMWPFNQPPAAALQRDHATTLPATWLDRLQRAAVNLDGASASFVSADGLVLTNHHVAMSCVQSLSSAKEDLVSRGFLARRRTDERRCPGVEATVLRGIDDVSARIQAVPDGAARRARIAEVEAACQAAHGQSCKVVPLYRGAAYHLYRSDRHDDVRLVFAPELQAAFFGGDPDNFVFPRHALDAAFVRIYHQGKPLHPQAWLRWNDAGPREGELLFVAGHPYSTERLLTVAQLAYQRDVANPLAITSATRRIATMKRYAAQSPEHARQAADEIFGLENWLKAVAGGQQALTQGDLLARKQAAETALRTASAGKVAGDPWQEAEQALALQRPRAASDWMAGFGYQGLLGVTGRLVQVVGERARPSGERLPEYRDAALPAVIDGIVADTPYYTGLEIARLTDRADEARSLLGATHPYTVALAGPQGDAAAYLAGVLRATRLGDAAERKRLLDGGAAALAASTDPLLALARQLDPLVREAREFAEDQIKPRLTRSAERIEQARFAAFGAAVAPDATGSLRLSYGVARGYDWHGYAVPWLTTVGGLHARADGFGHRAPFDLAPAWAAARPRLDPATPMNYVLTADITGGNSGSPVVNRAGELVGLIFDGNQSSLANTYLYGETTERALAVHPRVITHALEQVYRAPALLRELRGQ